MTRAKTVPITSVSLPSSSDEKNRSLTARWKHEVLLDKGWVPVPVRFFELYAQLKPFSLTPGEAMFVLHLMQFKWEEAAPFPGYKRIAGQMGISHKMARTHAKSLETKKLLRRQMRVGQTNRFDLVPLFDALSAAMTGHRRKPSRNSAQKISGAKARKAAG